MSRGASKASGKPFKQRSHDLARLRPSHRRDRRDGGARPARPALRRGAETPARPTSAFFEEQIAEIARERDEENLDPEEAEGARAEAARRLLRARSAVKGPGRRPVAPHGPGHRRAGGDRSHPRRVDPALSASLGAANLPDMPLEARLETTPREEAIAGAVARIEQHLRGASRGWPRLRGGRPLLPARRPRRGRHRRL